MREIKLLEPDDVALARELFQYFHVEFESENAPLLAADHLEYILQQEHFRVFIASEDGQLAGGVSAYQLLGSDYLHPELFIYDVAIKPEFRRKKIGTELMKFIRNWCRKHRIKEMFVFADAEDEHAVKFYKSVPGCEITEAGMFSFEMDYDEQHKSS